MDLGRLIRQNDDLSGVVSSEESLVAPIPCGFQDVCSFPFKLRCSFDLTYAAKPCFTDLFCSNRGPTVEVLRAINASPMLHP